MRPNSYLSDLHLSPSTMLHWLCEISSEMSRYLFSSENSMLIESTKHYLILFYPRMADFEVSILQFFFSQTLSFFIMVQNQTEGARQYTHRNTDLGV